MEKSLKQVLLIQILERGGNPKVQLCKIVGLINLYYSADAVKMVEKTALGRKSNEICINSFLLSFMLFKRKY